MGLSKLGGDENGLGFYEMMVCSDEEYQEVVHLIDQGMYKEAWAILGIKMLQEKSWQRRR